MAQDDGHQASDRPRPGDRDALAAHVTGAVHRVQGHGQRFGQDGEDHGLADREVPDPADMWNLAPLLAAKGLVIDEE
ncbi:hypothetical protein ACFWAZ_36505 [Streptomyces collinus]|uniref:hypothetical protein n=1 Tax=Streptomyces collinus TaxID=42684 RepID=UPI003646D103